MELATHSKPTSPSHPRHGSRRSAGSPPPSVSGRSLGQTSEPGCRTSYRVSALRASIPTAGAVGGSAAPCPTPKGQLPTGTAEAESHHTLLPHRSPAPQFGATRVLRHAGGADRVRRRGDGRRRPVPAHARAHPSGPARGRQNRLRLPVSQDGVVLFFQLNDPSRPARRLALSHHDEPRLALSNARSTRTGHQRTASWRRFELKATSRRLGMFVPWKLASSERARQGSAEVVWSGARSGSANVAETLTRFP